MRLSIIAAALAATFAAPATAQDRVTKYYVCYAYNLSTTYISPVTSKTDTFSLAVDGTSVENRWGNILAAAGVTATTVRSGCLGPKDSYQAADDDALELAAGERRKGHGVSYLSM